MDEDREDFRAALTELASLDFLGVLGDCERIAGFTEESLTEVTAAIRRGDDVAALEMIAVLVDMLRRYRATATSTLEATERMVTQLKENAAIFGKE